MAPSRQEDQMQLFDVLYAAYGLSEMERLHRHRDGERALSLPLPRHRQRQKLRQAVQRIVTTGYRADGYYFGNCIREDFGVKCIVWVQHWVGIHVMWDKCG